MKARRRWSGSVSASLLVAVMLGTALAASPQAAGAGASTEPAAVQAENRSYGVIFNETYKKAARLLKEKQGRPAAEAYRQVIEMLARQPEESAEMRARRASALAEAHIGLARALMMADDLTPALESAQQATRIYAAPGQKPSMQHAYSLHVVAGALDKLGRGDEALASMRRAYEVAVDAKGAEDRQARQLWWGLEGLKARLGRKAAPGSRGEGDL